MEAGEWDGTAPFATFVVLAEVQGYVLIYEDYA
jgi:hypothetical protein